MTLNQRVLASRQKLADLPLATIKALTECVVEAWGNPPTNLAVEALRSLHSSDYHTAKRSCLSDPCNASLGTVSCLASAYRSPVVADSGIKLILPV